MLSVKLPRSSYTPESRIANLSPTGTFTAAVVRYQSSSATVWSMYPEKPSKFGAGVRT